MLDCFLHVQVSNLSKVIFILTSKNGIVFLACSKVNLILGCWVLSFFINLVHDWSSSNIAKMSSIYLRYNLGDDSGSLHKSCSSISAIKKFASVGPSRQPIVTPSICLYSVSFCRSNPLVARLINLMKTSFLKDLAKTTFLKDVQNKIQDKTKQNFCIKTQVTRQLWRPQNEALLFLSELFSSCFVFSFNESVNAVNICILILMRAICSAKKV